MEKCELKKSDKLTLYSDIINGKLQLKSVDKR